MSGFYETGAPPAGTAGSEIFKNGERESTSKGSLYFYNYTHYDVRAQCASQGYGPIKPTLGAVVSMFKFSLHTNLLIVRVTCHL